MAIIQINDKKNCTDSIPLIDLKRPHTITKNEMNDNINMNSTIAGSMTT